MCKSNEANEWSLFIVVICCMCFVVYLQTELIEVAQNLIGMAAECCHKDAISCKLMSNDVLLAVVQPDTSMYSFCSALASQIGG